MRAKIKKRQRTANFERPWTYLGADQSQYIPSASQSFGHNLPMWVWPANDQPSIHHETWPLLTLLANDGCSSVEASTLYAKSNPRLPDFNRQITHFSQRSITPSHSQTVPDPLCTQPPDHHHHAVTVIQFTHWVRSITVVCVYLSWSFVYL